MSITYTENSTIVTTPTVQAVSDATQKEVQEQLNSVANEDKIVYDPDAAIQWFGQTDGSNFPDVTDIINKYADNMALQASYNMSAKNFLTSVKSQFVSQALKDLGITQIQNNMQKISSNLKSIGDTFTNFQTSGDFLQVADMTVDKLISSVEQIDGMIDYAEEIIGMAAQIPAKLISYAEKIDKMVEDFVNNSSDFIKNFPERIKESLMNLRIVQDLYGTYIRITNAVASIILTAKTSVEAPTTLKMIVLQLKRLKKIINYLQYIKEEVTETTKKIKAIADEISKGQYFAAIMSITGGLRFIQIPLSFKAKYPYNNSVTLPAGNISVDNTSGGERMSAQHKSGTYVEMNHKGDLVVNSKGTTQINSNEIFEANTSKSMKLTAKNFDALGDTVMIHSTPGGSISISGDDVDITSTTGIGISAPIAVNIQGAANASLASANETSVSAGGNLYLTSKTAIVMKAPSIQLLGEANTLINSPSNVILGAMTAITGASFVAKCGLISLN